MAELISVERTAGVGIIRLDRPPLNVISLQMQEELCQAAWQVDADPGVAAVVIHGGERNFAAGADVKEMARMSEADLRDRPEGLQTCFTALAGVSKPVVAAITGYALGGGCELALCADLRFCADNAVLGQPEVSLGIMPGSGGTQRLPRVVGASRAKDLVLTGRRVDSAEALRIGLADRVFPADAVLREAIAWAGQFAGGPACALAAAKKAIDQGLSGSLEDGLAIERHLFAPLFSTRDRATGMSHFIDKLPGRPAFEGR